MLQKQVYLERDQTNKTVFLIHLSQTCIICPLLDRKLKVRFWIQNLKISKSMIILIRKNKDAHWDPQEIALIEM